MKKIISFITVLVIVIAAALTFAGCSKGGNYNYVTDLEIRSIIYLSDSDALKIIAEELKNAGYDFINYNAAGYDPVTGKAVGDFEFDGHIINGENKINLEYVSFEDFTSKKYPGLAYTTALTASISSSADSIRLMVSDSYSAWFKVNSPEIISKQLKGNYAGAAIFYADDSTSQEQAEEKLRAQALDFIEWLISAEA